MPTVNQDIEIRARGTQIIQQITRDLGIFNKQGLAMGVTFAGIQLGVNALQQALSGAMQYIQDGIELNREFELSLTRLSVSTKEFDVSLGSLKTSLQAFSVLFATDVNELTTQLQRFIQEGYSASQSLKMVFQTGQLAVATNSDLADVQATINTAMEVFNLNASDTGFIMKKLNEIMSTTNMSIGAVDTVLGRTAINAQEAGINFNDFVNIIYTLEEKGVAPRNMIIEINKALEDLSNFSITAMPTDKVTSILDKYQKIIETGVMTKKMIEQINTLQQMQLTSGLDVGGAYDKSIVEEAKRIRAGGASLTQLQVLSGGITGALALKKWTMIKEVINALDICFSGVNSTQAVFTDFH